MEHDAAWGVNVLLTWLDWLIIVGSMLISVLLGILGGRHSGTSSEEYFLSGRSMPGWLLGTSMVATTFSTDTPNLVTGLTRTYGIAGNWLWWAFLVTCMLTGFFFAHLWRRSGVTTDMEFYELRYSGKPAAFLRAFRSMYVGVLVNVLIMGAVTLAAVKFGSVLFGFTPLQCIVVAGTATAIFSVAGGFRGVVISDCFLFVLAMTGAIAAAVFAVNHPDVGGLQALFSHPNVVAKADFIPSLDTPEVFVTLLVMPLLVQWWSVWYPGAEPGGGGFVAQRMLAAKDEKHSIQAIFLFNVAHYALRPWPWILVALASLIVFPDVDSLRRSFPSVDPQVINEDFAYAAMLTFIPSGWIGVMAASLIAAYISTLATGLNMGSAYIVNDVYQRFLRKDASEREKVLMGRIATAALMVLIGFVGLSLESAMQAFNMLLSIGAGTGLLFMLRWYWPRINAWSEIAAMVISFAISLVMQLSPLAVALPEWQKLLIAVGVTTAGWIAVTYLTPREPDEVLREFCKRVNPPGKAWEKIAAMAGVGEAHIKETSRVGSGFVCMLAGCGFVYALMFATGSLLRGDLLLTLVFTAASVGGAWLCHRGWRGMNFDERVASPISAPTRAVATPAATN
jgi:solute:Na+ symporter, SSS family